LKYLRLNGYKANAETCAYAAGGGSVECLKYLHETGCEWDSKTCENAAKEGNIECLKYARENGCARDSGRLLAICIRDRVCVGIPCGEYDHSEYDVWIEYAKIMDPDRWKTRTTCLGCGRVTIPARSTE
jgi:hypothetical protein